MFFIPPLGLDIYLMNAEFTALRIWLTQMIQTSGETVASLELNLSELEIN